MKFQKGNTDTYRHDGRLILTETKESASRTSSICTPIIFMDESKSQKKFFKVIRYVDKNNTGYFSIRYKDGTIRLLTSEPYYQTIGGGRELNAIIRGKCNWYANTIDVSIDKQSCIKIPHYSNKHAAISCGSYLDVLLHNAKRNPNFVQTSTGYNRQYRSVLVIDSDMDFNISDFDYEKSKKSKVFGTMCDVIRHNYEMMGITPVVVYNHESRHIQLHYFFSEAMMIKKVNPDFDIQLNAYFEKSIKPDLDNEGICDFDDRTFRYAYLKDSEYSQLFRRMNKLMNTNEIGDSNFTGWRCKNIFYIPDNDDNPRLTTFLCIYDTFSKQVIFNKIDTRRVVNDVSYYKKFKADVIKYCSSPWVEYYKAMELMHPDLHSNALYGFSNAETVYIANRLNQEIGLPSIEIVKEDPYEDDESMEDNHRRKIDISPALVHYNINEFSTDINFKKLTSLALEEVRVGNWGRHDLCWLLCPILLRCVVRSHGYNTCEDIISNQKTIMDETSKYISIVYYKVMEAYKFALPGTKDYNIPFNENSVIRNNLSILISTYNPDKKKILTIYNELGNVKWVKDPRSVVDPHKNKAVVRMNRIICTMLAIYKFYGRWCVKSMMTVKQFNKLKDQGEISSPDPTIDISLSEYNERTIIKKFFEKEKKSLGTWLEEFSKNTYGFSYSGYISDISKMMYNNLLDYKCTDKVREIYYRLLPQELFYILRGDKSISELIDWDMKDEIEKMRSLRDMYMNDTFMESITSVLLASRCVNIGSYKSADKYQEVRQHFTSMVDNDELFSLFEYAQNREAS